MSVVELKKKKTVKILFVNDSLLLNVLNSLKKLHSVLNSSVELSHRDLFILKYTKARRIAVRTLPVAFSFPLDEGCDFLFDSPFLSTLTEEWVPAQPRICLEVSLCSLFCGGEHPEVKPILPVV